MKLETFFEKFDQFADAPDAVAKMRELVLELAVHGKLVAPSPNPDKHPAWLAFRKEISERVYSYDPGPPPPFEIPAHWEWCVLDEVADCRAAAKVSPAAIRDTDWVLDLEDIDGTTGQIIQTATFAERRSLSTKAAFEPGDVLYGKLRPYLNKVVVAAKRGFCTTEIIPLRPAPFLTPEFLRFYLRSQTFLCYAAQKNYGMKMPRLGTKDLESAEIPVPPPAEQKRIVAKVDELMALCDRLEAQQQERETRHAALARASLARFALNPQPSTLNFLFHPSYAIPPADLRKSILTLAVQGTLVPQDPNDEPAEAIVGRNEELSADASFEIPDQWTWTQLSQLAEINGGFAFKSTAYTDEGTRVVRISDFDEFGFKDHKVVRHPFTPDLQKFTLAESNILMAMTGGTVGKSYFVRSLPEPMVVNQRVATIKISAKANPSYVDIAIRSEMTQDVIRKAKNSTNDNISMVDIKGFGIPIPPLAEQRRIVAKVEQLMALVDALETQLAASRATAANLLSALVAELTAQG